MSTDNNPTTNDPPVDDLTDEERELFERLHDAYEDEPLGRVFELALQSSDDESEATTS